MTVTTLPISEIVIGERIRKNPTNMLGLATSISRVGLLHPIVVNSRRELIAGFRRLEAVKKLGWTEIPANVVESLDDAVLALKAELYENTDREMLPPTESLIVGRRIEEMEKPAAKARQKAHGNTAPGKMKNTPGNLPGVCEAEGRVRDKVAEALGVSGSTFDRMKRVATAAEKEPEKFGDLPAKMDNESVDAAYKELRARRDEAPEPDKELLATWYMIREWVKRWDKKHPPESQIKDMHEWVDELREAAP